MNRIPKSFRFASLIGIVLLASIGLYAFTAFPGSQQNPPNGVDDDYKISKIVIDAGHGGHDAGCSGAHSKEKHIALNIALKLGAYIEERIPGVEVIYTRKKDVFVELHERAAIANRVNADLFISIHCNANNSHSPYGTETYVMGLHKNDANLGVAKRENEVIALESNYNANYDGFDPSTPNAHIIFSLFQSVYLEQSILFASLIENQFAKRVSRKSRGVKQAGFLVLYKTAMPSVLIETGFLSNRTEEKFLHSDQGQDLMASAIFRAFRDYKHQMENLHTSEPVLVTLPEQTAAPDEVAQPAQENTETDISPAENEVVANVELVSTSNPAATSAESVDGTEAETASVEMVESKIYLVQIYASSKVYKPEDPIFSSIKGENIQLVQEKDIYKYMVGEYASQEAASAKKLELRERGFKDAFVVSWLRQVPVSTDQASIR